MRILDDPSFYKSKREFYIWLASVHGLKKSDYLKFLNDENSAFEWAMIPESRINIKSPEVNDLVNRGVELGYLSE